MTTDRIKLAEELSVAQRRALLGKRNWKSVTPPLLRKGLIEYYPVGPDRNEIRLTKLGHQVASALRALKAGE